jgi:hypothetical protein
VFYFLGSFTITQTILQGTIIDDEGLPISVTNVILKSENSQSIVVYGYSYENGKYELKRIRQESLY